MQRLSFPHRITIERPDTAQDPATGNESTVWRPVTGFIRIPAEVLPDRAGEFFAARQVQATANAMIRMWYQPGLHSTMRAVHHVRPGIDEYWDIQGLVPFQYQQRELRLMCLWRDAEGYRRGSDLENPEASGAEDSPAPSFDSESFTFDGAGVGYTWDAA